MVTQRIIQCLAIEADCDPSSVRKILSGQPVRGRSARRIVNALEARGLLKEINHGVADDSLIEALRSGIIPRRADEVCENEEPMETK